MVRALNERPLGPEDPGRPGSSGRSERPERLPRLVRAASVTALHRIGGSGVEAGVSSAIWPQEGLRVLICTCSEVTAFVVRGLVERVAQASVEAVKLPVERCEPATVVAWLDGFDAETYDLLVLDVEPVGFGLVHWLERLSQRSAGAPLARRLVLLVPVDFGSLSPEVETRVDLVLRKPLDVDRVAVEIEQLLATEPVSQVLPSVRLTSRGPLAPGLDS